MTSTGEDGTATSIDPARPISISSAIPKPQLDTLLDGIGYIHAHCVLHDGTLATYLPPLSYSKLRRFWDNNLAQVNQGQRHIVVQLMPVSSRTNSIAEVVFAADSSKPVSAPSLNINNVEYEVAGVMSLHMPESETGPFRGLVEKVFTSPNHRRKGIMRTVMRELERLARQDGRWSLLLDTTVGTDAEGVYPRLGYTRMGEINAYGISPKTGEYVDEVWYWKDLRGATEL